MSAPYGVVIFASSDVEGQLVQAIDSSEELRVIRRCADLTEVRAAAQSHIAEFAVIDGEDADLDSSILEELHEGGLRVVLLGSLAHAPRLRLIGADAVVHPSIPEQAIESLMAFVRSGTINLSAERLTDHAEEQLLSGGNEHENVAGFQKVSSRGKVIAVWGTSGAPGRSTMAINIATVLSEAQSVLLIDADTSYSSIAHMLGVAHDISGLSVASRAANRGYLNQDDLISSTVRGPGNARILTGISAPQRWREISPSAVSAVLKVAADHFDWIVVDVGAVTLDPVGEAPRHRGTRDDLVGMVLREADHVALIGRADAVGLNRLITTYQWWKETKASASVNVIINQASTHAAGPRPTNAICQSLASVLPGHVISIVPYDEHVKASGLHAQAVVTESPHCPFSQAIRELCVVFRPAREGVAEATTFLSRKQRKERDKMKAKEKKA